MSGRRDPFAAVGFWRFLGMITPFLFTFGLYSRFSEWWAAALLGFVVQQTIKGAVRLGAEIERTAERDRLLGQPEVRMPIAALMDDVLVQQVRDRIARERGES